MGDPAIVLRCGVPRPAEMNSAGAVGADLKGVGWMLGSRVVDGRHLCTTTLREIYVEVSVPTRYGDVFALEGLAAAVRKNVPRASATSPDTLTPPGTKAGAPTPDGAGLLGYCIRSGSKHWAQESRRLRAG
ncbi:hypothetical protein SAV31267_043830 [Streptomyces avermitilis]|uniref:Uncharacterized protein n=1 Tax=Streptomyces avermitilis TaxID=33903 RepID=A0A4D4MRY1_STRAX|nr:hypothetical protein SAV31267_043830 [Streptomyces avermitilis]